MESQALYNVLENEVIPCFYERKGGEPPERWVRMMKEAMKMALVQFSGYRMVDEYDKRFYRPAAHRMADLLEDGGKKAGELVHQLDRITALWQDVRIERPVREAEGPFRVGDSFQVTAKVHLGQLRPEEVDVELYYGQVKAFSVLPEGETALMNVKESLGESEYRYVCTIPCRGSGRFGFMARVTPRADHWIKTRPGFIHWST